MSAVLRCHALRNLTASAAARRVVAPSRVWSRCTPAIQPQRWVSHNRSGNSPGSKDEEPIQEPVPPQPFQAQVNPPEPGTPSKPNYFPPPPEDPNHFTAKVPQPQLRPESDYEIGLLRNIPEIPPNPLYDPIHGKIDMPASHQAYDPDRLKRELAAENKEMDRLRLEYLRSSPEERKEREWYTPPEDGPVKSGTQSARGAISDVLGFAKRLIIVAVTVITLDHIYQGGWIAYIEYVGVPGMLEPARQAVEQGNDPYGWNQDYLLDHSYAAPGIKGTDPKWPLWSRREAGYAWRSMTHGGMVPRAVVDAAPETDDQSERLAYDAYLRRLAHDNGFVNAENQLNDAVKELSTINDKVLGIPILENLQMLFPDAHALAATAVDPSAVAAMTQLSYLQTVVGNERTLNRLTREQARLFDVLQFVGPEGQHALGIVPQQMPLLASRVAAAHADSDRPEQAIQWYNRTFASLPWGTSTETPHAVWCPAVTRVFITSLLGLARLYALPPAHADQQQELVVTNDFERRLRQSLQYQTLAVRWVRHEMEQLTGESLIDADPHESPVRPHPIVSGAPAPESTKVLYQPLLDQVRSRTLGIRKVPSLAERAQSVDDSKQLYFAWLLTQDAQASLLLAQTTYALQQASSQSIWRRLNPFRRSARTSAETIAWLTEASADAQRILSLLSAPPSLETAKQVMVVGEGHALAPQWAENPVMKHFALNVLESAETLDKSAQGMLDVLGAQR